MIALNPSPLEQECEKSRNADHTRKRLASEDVRGMPATHGARCPKCLSEVASVMRQGRPTPTA